MDPSGSGSPSDKFVTTSRLSLSKVGVVEADQEQEQYMGIRRSLAKFREREAASRGKGEGAKEWKSPTFIKPLVIRRSPNLPTYSVPSLVDASAGSGDREPDRNWRSDRRKDLKSLHRSQEFGSDTLQGRERDRNRERDQDHLLQGERKLDQSCRRVAYSTPRLDFDGGHPRNNADRCNGGGGPGGGGMGGGKGAVGGWGDVGATSASSNSLHIRTESRHRGKSFSPARYRSDDSLQDKGSFLADPETRPDPEQDIAPSRGDSALVEEPFDLDRCLQELTLDTTEDESATASGGRGGSSPEPEQAGSLVLDDDNNDNDNDGVLEIDDSAADSLLRVDEAGSESATDEHFQATNGMATDYVRSRGDESRDCLQDLGSRFLDLSRFTSPDMPGYVGFANLPNQVHRKSVKKGFEFTLMVVGESGLGKSTLVNSLFLTDLYPDRKIPGAAEKIEKTVAIDTSTVEIEERGVRLRLTVVDTPGFGDAMNNNDSFRSVIKYIDDQFEKYLNDESGLNRRNIIDNRVHCCFYFINPAGHGLKPLDMAFMKAVHLKLNIVPVIAKADTLTRPEVIRLKHKVMRQIEEQGIQIYPLPDCDEDEDEEYKQQCSQLKDAVPFAVVGSNTIMEVRGRKVRGRTYPWGVVEVENPEHCDFIKLRTMLITHMQDLQEVTQEIHYENFRSERLAGQVGTKRIGKHRRDSTEIFQKEEKLSEKEKQLAEKEVELRRMQDMLSQMQAEMGRQRSASGAAGVPGSHPAMPGGAAAAAGPTQSNNNSKGAAGGPGANGSVNGVGPKAAPLVKMNQV